MIEVSDGQRLLKFEGEELAFSTSERPGADRWIEFTLYRTLQDRRYVIARVGVSNLYHSPECRIAKQGKLPEIPYPSLERGQVPCQECRPSPDDFPLVCAERDKTWARDYRDPQSVIKALMRRDPDGSTYLNAVSRRLLDEASYKDIGIAGAYRVQTLT